MEQLKFTKVETISLKNNPQYNEKWLQGKIEEDPSILGLGQLQFLKSEKTQLQGGRIDTILIDREANRHYEVEIQLGETDASHIIRTIEYWDNERKRYRQHDHCAVIIAEEITNRFFNVISLFNGHIPIIAIQVKAIKIEDKVALFFTKVLDEQKNASESDYIPSDPTDEEYWLKKSSKESMSLLNRFKEKFADYLGDYNLKYNKVYIGLAKDNMANNFVSFTPQRQNVVVSFRTNRSDEIDNKLNNFFQSTYDTYYRSYRIWITEKNLTENKELLSLLVKSAYDNK